MWTTIKDTLDEKHFVMALLTILAAVGAHFGLNIDTTTIVLLMTPMMIAIGAHGWGAAAAATTAANPPPPAVAVAAAAAPAPAATSTPPLALGAADVRVSSPKGFVRVSVLAAIAVVATITVVPFVACSPGARTTTINTTVATLDAAQKSLQTYVQDHESTIVTGATSLADGQGKLATFRSAVNKVELAIATGYRAAAAATAANDDSTLTALSQAALLVAGELAAIEKGLSP